MMVLAGWSAAMAWLWWCGRTRQAWLASGGVLPGAVASHQLWMMVVVGALSVWLSRRGGGQPEDVAKPPSTAAWARFWQQVSVLLTAGLTFWQAVEAAAAAEEIVAKPVLAAARVIMGHTQGRVEIAGLEGPDGEMSVLLLQHGYLHGLRAEQIGWHVRHLEAATAFQRDFRKRRDPLWLTILPALLLLNVLAVFMVPMVVMAGHGWLKL